MTAALTGRYSERCTGRYSDPSSERPTDAESRGQRVEGRDRGRDLFYRGFSCGCSVQLRFESLSTYTCETATHRIEVR